MHPLLLTCVNIFLLLHIFSLWKLMFAESLKKYRNSSDWLSQWQWVKNAPLTVAARKLWWCRKQEWMEAWLPDYQWLGSLSQRWALPGGRLPCKSPPTTSPPPSWCRPPPGSYHPESQAWWEARWGRCGRETMSTLCPGGWRRQQGEKDGDDGVPLLEGMWETSLSQKPALASPQREFGTKDTFLAFPFLNSFPSCF